MVEKMVAVNGFLKTKLPKTEEKSGEKSKNERIKALYKPFQVFNYISRPANLTNQVFNCYCLIQFWLDSSLFHL